MLPELPYDQVLKDAGRAGRILHRENIYGSGPPNKVANPEVLSLITSQARSPILDVGCGIGPYVSALAEKGFIAHGVEVNASYVETARTLSRSVQIYDGTRLPFGDCTFDTVIAIEVLEHIPDWEHTFREMLRVAVRSILISVPNIGVIPSMSRHLVIPWHLLEATHVNFFTAEILTTYLNRISGISSRVRTYAAFQVNGDIYQNHVFASIQKKSVPK
jgi:2-polyprenyl-3-methyl-5-hydroxy-6-metoxy-1,4-benzoquinol methylase